MALYNKKVSTSGERYEDRVLLWGTTHAMGTPERESAIARTGRLGTQSLGGREKKHNRVFAKKKILDFHKRGGGGRLTNLTCPERGFSISHRAFIKVLIVEGKEGKKFFYMGEGVITPENFTTLGEPLF